MRVGRILKLAEGKSATSDVIVRIQSHLAVAKDLGTRRNRVAHNPVFLS